MEHWMGYRVVINPLVKPRSYLVSQQDAVIAFHDREDMYRTIFWARMLPRLNALSREAWEEWRALGRNRR